MSRLQFKFEEEDYRIPVSPTSTNAALLHSKSSPVRSASPAVKKRPRRQLEPIHGTASLVSPMQIQTEHQLEKEAAQQQLLSKIEAMISSPNRSYPRLITMNQLVKVHTHELYHGAFVHRSAVRWETMDERRPPHSDGENAMKTLQQSSILLIQCVWRRQLAIRQRKSRRAEVLRDQMTIAAWIAQFTPRLHHAMMLFERYSTLCAITSLWTSPSDVSPLCIPSAYRNLAATTLQFALRFAFAKRKARFLVRSPALLRGFSSSFSSALDPITARLRSYFCFVLFHLIF